MPTKVHLPDGRIINFPDGMTPQQIAVEVQKLAPAEPTLNVERGPVNAPALQQAAQPQRPVVTATAGGRGTGLDVRKFGDFAAGVRSSGAATVYGGGELIRRATGQPSILQTPEVQALVTPPNSAHGKAGRFVADAAQFAVPTARVAKAVAARGLATRAAAEGATSGAVAAVQSGGDMEQTALGVAGGAVLPFAAKAAGAAASAVGRAAAGAKDGGIPGALASAVRESIPTPPKNMLIQALKPRSTRTGFQHALDRALPEIKAAEAQIGKPIEGVNDLMAAVSTAKKAIRAQIDEMAGPMRQAGFQVDLSGVADAIENSIPKKVRLRDPKKAETIIEQAGMYRRPFDLEEAEQLLRETNAELEAFYNKYPAARRNAVAADPEIAMNVAEAKALRDAIYKRLDDAGGGEAARELQRRYGALLEVENEAVRRINVAARQQPESLSEQIGAVRAAADMARGAWRLTHGDLTGAADIAAARAGRATAKYLKDQQTTDALIRRAFASYKGAPVPVQMPPKRQIAGLLKPAPIVTPPPVRVDDSAVRGVPAAPIAHEVDPYVPGRQGVRVTQYAGDPAAEAAKVVTDADLPMLQAMREDIDTFIPQRGKLVRDGDDAYYAYGGAGSRVADDIRVISGQHVSNREIANAIDDLMEGKPPTTKLHTAILDALQGYAEGRPGYHPPTIPQWADDPEYQRFSRGFDE